MEIIRKNKFVDVTVVEKGPSISRIDYCGTEFSVPSDKLLKKLDPKIVYCLDSKSRYLLLQNLLTDDCKKSVVCGQLVWVMVGTANRLGVVIDVGKYVSVWIRGTNRATYRNFPYTHLLPTEQYVTVGMEKPPHTIPVATEKQVNFLNITF